MRLGTEVIRLLARIEHVWLANGEAGAGGAGTEIGPNPDRELTNRSAGLKCPGTAGSVV